MNDIDDLFQKAWDSEIPLSLDRLAERLAQEGVAEQVLLDAGARLLIKVRDAGADEELEERILGVMDRLVGWCSADFRITTKPVAMLEKNNHTPTPSTSPDSLAPASI